MPPTFLEPCVCYAGICTIYPERPRTCRTFRCKLLRALDKEEVTLADARARVAIARAATARRHVALVALNRFLDRHFRAKYEAAADAKAPPFGA